MLTVYNFLSYFQHKSKTHLFYATYTLLLFIAYFTFTKNDFLDVISKPLENFFSLTHEFWVWLYNIVYYYFVFSFLNFQQHHKRQTKIIKYILLFLLGLGIIGFIIAVFFDDKTFLLKTYLLVYMPIIISLTLYCFYLVYKTPEKTKIYILIGSFVLFLSSILTISIIELKLFTENSEIGFLIFYIGIVIENIFFSLGLGLRQKIILVERDEAKNALILKLKENKNLKEKINIDLKEKLEVLKAQKKLEEEINDLKLITLKNQMNPHFIFNALNSIKLYIINNERKNATYYLNKFSKLIRIILEASSQKETSLNNELETMALYMNIENIRFSNEIDFQIITKENINLETIKVPPLVFQPFLENSLWHGLSSKKKNKKVRLYVDKIGQNFVKIIIEDNGIGREAAAKIKSEKSINRKSIGINLTKKRLHNFVKNYKNNFSLIYEDVLNDQKNIVGTKVILTIPLV